MIYIGPGEWNIESIMLRKGQTLYLAGGSVVHGIANANLRVISQYADGEFWMDRIPKDGRGRTRTFR